MGFEVVCPELGCGWELQAATEEEAKAGTGWEGHAIEAEGGPGDARGGAEKV
jgi:hypothetical protein